MSVLVTLTHRPRLLAQAGVRIGSASPARRATTVSIIQRSWRFLWRLIDAHSGGAAGCAVDRAGMIRPFVRGAGLKTMLGPPASWPGTSPKFGLEGDDRSGAARNGTGTPSTSDDPGLIRRLGARRSLRDRRQTIDHLLDIRARCSACATADRPRQLFVDIVDFRAALRTGR
jgi:hypothetical protein